MKTFKDLEFDSHPNGRGGVQAKIQFPNGFGASAVQSPYSYGGNSGLYEIAVLDKEGDITYDTPITDNVVGWLDEDKVTDYLRKIQSL